MGREMQTLCYVQDLLLQGKIASATDVITQRLNGLERVASGSHYTATQRQCAPRCRGDDDAFRDARSDEVAARGGPCKNVIQTMGKKMGEEKERQRWQGQRKDQGRPEPRKGRQRQCKEVRRKTFWEQAGSGYEGSMKPLAGSEEIARLVEEPESTEDEGEIPGDGRKKIESSESWRRHFFHACLGDRPVPAEPLLLFMSRLVAHCGVLRREFCLT